MLHRQVFARIIESLIRSKSGFQLFPSLPSPPLPRKCTFSLSWSLFVLNFSHLSVQDDVIASLKLKTPRLFITSFNRVSHLIVLLIFWLFIDWCSFSPTFHMRFALKI